ncbi:MAG TPA: alanine racemase [Jiangellaceae bacterium]|nr:alanine racemase [Jiangellaceae bacterium]
MPLILQVDSGRWRDHLKSYVGTHAGVVPVAKGNGYGFGTPVLAAEAAALGVPTLAVGTYDELPAVQAFPGETLVLSPWRPGTQATAGRVIHTVSRLSDLHDLAAEPDRRDVVVEVLTSMRRHGLVAGEVAHAAALLRAVRFRGWALHLPLTGDRLGEARTLAGQLLALAPGPLWVSHLDPTDVATLAAELSTQVRLRVGTGLWLGARSALRARATVLDVHDVRRGDTFGYRQRRARRSGSLVIVAGGTAHGIALEAPTPAASLRQRAVAVAKGGLEAAGWALSPFHIGGKQRWFAEPPHMQCSMIWLPPGVARPAVGDELDVDVRLTTTTFDQIRWN